MMKLSTRTPGANHGGNPYCPTYLDTSPGTKSVAAQRNQTPPKIIKGVPPSTSRDVVAGFFIPDRKSLLETRTALRDKAFRASRAREFPYATRILGPISLTCPDRSDIGTGWPADKLGQVALDGVVR
jgi:hypothetical protein